MGKARTRATTSGVTLDAGALIALLRGDRRMIALLDLAQKRGRTFRVPAGVVAQVFRDGSRQAVLTRFLRSDDVQVVPLDDPLARACGELCGLVGSTDVIDASVVLVARQHDDAIVTSDPDDLQRLSPRAPIVRI